MANLRRTIIVHLQILVMAVLLNNCFGQSRNDSITLMDDMLRGYDKRHRPVVNQSDAVNVNISFSVVSIQDFDEVSETVSVVLLFNITWMDEVINWNPASYGGIASQIYDIEEVWYPILVLGTASESIQDLVEKWMTLRIYSTGQVVLEPGLLIKSTCSVDVTYYPFDKQTCQMMMLPFLENLQEMTLTAPVSFANMMFYRENGEWNLIQTKTYVETAGGQPMMYLELILERKPLFAVTNTILPIILMSMLNLMVFVLPVEAGERVSYAITVLLALAVFLTLVSDTLPSISEPMSILAFFLMLSLFISAFICIAVIMNLRVYHKVDSQPVSPWQRRIVRLLRCNNKVLNQSNNKVTQLNKSDDDSDQVKTAPTDEPEVEISWQNVASAIDKLLLLAFGAASLITSIVFVIILAASK